MQLTSMLLSVWAFTLWALLLSSTMVAVEASPLHKWHLKAAFEDFKRAYNRHYKSKEEETKRFDCFGQTMQRIEELRKTDEANHGVNQFADLCPHEFKSRFHNLKFNPLRHRKRGVQLTAPAMEKLAAAPVPKSWDWRQKGAVSPVKNQEQCGSCWTFSAVAAMEGAWFLAGHPLTELSEEQLVQCATSAGQGCEGGEMGDAIEWVVQNGGIASEEAYPYTSGSGFTGDCQNDTQAVKPVAKFKDLLKFTANESLLAAFLVKHGPLFIGVDASDGWQTYMGGVKTTCGGADLDHGVALVGFGPNYWIVRNSWGSMWGEEGYIRLKRGVNCDGILADVGTALV